jgi:ABC-type phosphate transport system substrate-binding protein
MLRAGPPPCLPTAYGLLPIRRRVLVLVALVALCLVVASDLRAAEGGFVVVGHAATVQSELERAFVADAFLKKRTRWPNGEAIRPVDQRRDAPARRHFSETVLKRSVDAVRSYWQQRIFSGRDVPPPEADSDLSVLRYVQENAGAIGYVSDAPNVQGVRVVTLK